MSSAAIAFESQADALIASRALGKSELVVVDTQTTIIEELPPPPYDTASLLEDATARLQWNSEKIMQVAQSLFEGIELHGAHEGLITYHRTDSRKVSIEAALAARTVIEKEYGRDVLPQKPHYVSLPIVESNARQGGWLWHFLDRFRRGAKEKPAIITAGHEAIRPTVAERTPEKLGNVLAAEEFDLYKLIWLRFIGSQMKPAKYRITHADLDVVHENSSD